MIQKKFDPEYMGPYFYLDELGTEQFDKKMDELKRLEFKHHCLRVRGPHFVRSQSGEERHFEQSPTEGYRFVNSLVIDIIDLVASKALNSNKQLPMLLSVQGPVYLMKGILGSKAVSIIGMEERYAIASIGDIIPQEFVEGLRPFATGIGIGPVHQDISHKVWLKKDNVPYQPAMHWLEFTVL
jgi:hypothetical protein